MTKPNDNISKDNNCHIPDLVQAFSIVENGGYSAKPLTFTTVSLKTVHSSVSIEYTVDDTRLAYQIIGLVSFMSLYQC